MQKPTYYYIILLFNILLNLLVYLHIYITNKPKPNAKYVQHYLFSGLWVHLKCEAHEGHESVTRKFEELSWYKIP